MAVKYKYNITRKIVDWIIQWLIRLDRAPQQYFLLTVPDRKTSRPHSKPVTFLEEGRQKWLMAPYGAVDWVLNARAAGMVTIARGGYAEEFSIKEIPIDAHAPILKQYITLFPVKHPYFDAQPSDPVERFTPEAQLLPVFQLRK